MNRLKKILKYYFDPKLELQVRLFNVIAIGGFLTSVFSGILNIFNRDVTNAVITLFLAIFSFVILTYSRKSGHYQRCYTITIIVVFLIFFPLSFFTGGGYHSGMPSFFIFAIVFTVFMLDGKRSIIVSAIELLTYIGLCLIAYFCPETIHRFSSEQEMLLDIIVVFTVVSIILGICMYLHIGMYRQQQKKLDEQNRILEQASRAKSQFFSNASHEMRTPLTVISVNVQTVSDLLKNMDETVKDAETEELLQGAQGEIMRLGRMISGMFTLTSMGENADKVPLDLSHLMQSCADMLRLNLQKWGNTMETQIEKGLYVFGNADLLMQVVTNLLQNANTHTKDGMIVLSLDRSGSEITATVTDNGSGISPELLPHVFERGVSTGGTGLGLSLCKTIIESHGGKIKIESKKGTGTKVIFVLPAYEGQF